MPRQSGRASFQKETEIRRTLPWKPTLNPRNRVLRLALKRRSVAAPIACEAAPRNKKRGSSCTSHSPNLVKQFRRAPCHQPRKSIDALVLPQEACLRVNVVSRGQPTFSIFEKFTSCLSSSAPARHLPRTADRRDSRYAPRQNAGEREATDSSYRRVDSC
jgi:hypothetical protein